MLYKVVLTFEPVDEILKCDQATELYFPVILYVALNKVVLTSLFYSQMCPSVRTITVFNKQKLAHLKWSTQNNFLKKSFSSTEEERASDDKMILNVTII